MRMNIETDLNHLLCEVRAARSPDNDRMIGFILERIIVLADIVQSMNTLQVQRSNNEHHFCPPPRIVDRLSIAEGALLKIAHGDLIENREVARNALRRFGYKI